MKLKIALLLFGFCSAASAQSPHCAIAKTQVNQMLWSSTKEMLLRERDAAISPPSMQASVLHEVRAQNALLRLTVAIAHLRDHRCTMPLPLPSEALFSEIAEECIRGKIAQLNTTRAGAISRCAEGPESTMPREAWK